MTDNNTEHSSCDDTCQVSEAGPISHEIGHVIHTLRSQWLSPASKPHNFLVRFIIAFMGASSFWVAFVILQPVVDVGKKIEIAWPLLANPVYFSPPLISLWFAWLISWKDNSYGPTRLYLSALLLSAFVYSIIRLTLL